MTRASRGFASTDAGAAWADHNQQWLVSAIMRLRERIEAQAASEPTHAPAPRLEEVADDMPAFTPALVRCGELFRLSRFERELLLMVVGAEIDRGLAATIRSVNGGSSYVTFSFALRMLSQPHWDALSPDAPLRAWRLIDAEPGVPLAHAALRVDERVMHYITGVFAHDAHLFGMARLMAPEQQSAIGGDFVDQIISALCDEAVHRVVVLFNNPLDFAALREAVVGTAAALGAPTLWLNAQDLPVHAPERAELAIYVDREARLTGALPVIMCDGGERAAQATAFIAHMQSPVLWLGPPGERSVLQAKPRRQVRIEVPAIDAQAAVALQARTNGSRPDHFAALHRALAQFHLGRAALEEVAELVQQAPAEERERVAWNAARELARGGLDALAQRIVTTVSFDDVVLPAGQLAVLREITRHLRHRERVYRDWGFGAKHMRGQGLTALFSGESGTGKTLAAEAIANEVQLDLYRVDLATVVSKYIGETEKNLKRLFDAAEASGAVLLFDEADALFGKRSEVKDSHDRYANIEVAYLLQRVEAYRGLAILTTNMKSALDRAFLRRIRFIVHFPFPDTAAREQIWRRQLPERAPVGDVDFRALATLNLAGGHINSIAVSAAFNAADRGVPIDQRAMIEAARAEFAKLERSFNGALRGDDA
jgi:AAA+ superfamily predicted ATPase